MSLLSDHVTDYLGVRRALGYKLHRDESLLGQFIAYLEHQGVRTITTEHALAWAMLPAGHRAWHAHRLSVVRVFARYLRAFDPETEVPPDELLPWRRCRAVPYIYSDQQIVALMKATGALRTAHRRATFRTLIGLLAATGMRLGESISLDRRNIDWQAGWIEIHGAKFGKSRELPLHPTAVQALHRYVRRRDRPLAATPTDAVFVSTAGTRLLACSVDSTFHRLVGLAGIEPRSSSCRPRLHDLRHSFAVRTLLDAYRREGDPEASLALLSTYLGHTSPKSTYWYLEAVPELMQLAAARLEDHLGGLP